MRLSDVYTEQITYHNGAGAKVLMMSPWHENYNPGTSAAIVNAIQGSNNYGDGQWFGYAGNDCEVIIDLQKIQSINTLKTNFIEKKNSWIYAPSQVQFFAGNDTAKMEMIFETKPSGGQVINTIVTPALNKNARYIKMVMKNYGIIPSGMDGAGNKAWMFVDEIILD
jgi:hexosaminidase